MPSVLTTIREEDIPRRSDLFLEIKVINLLRHMGQEWALQMNMIKQEIAFQLIELNLLKAD